MFYKELTSLFPAESSDMFLNQTPSSLCMFSLCHRGFLGLKSVFEKGMNMFNYQQLIISVYIQQKKQNKKADPTAAGTK